MPDSDQELKEEFRLKIGIFVFSFLTFFLFLLGASFLWFSNTNQTTTEEPEIAGEKDLPQGSILLAFIPPTETVVWYVDRYPYWDWSNAGEITIVNNTTVDLRFPTWKSIFEETKIIDEANRDFIFNKIATQHEIYAQNITAGSQPYNLLIDFIKYNQETTDDQGIVFFIDQSEGFIPAGETRTYSVYLEANSLTSTVELKKLDNVIGIPVQVKLQYGKIISDTHTITNSVTDDEMVIKSEPEIVFGVKTYFENE